MKTLRVKNVCYYCDQADDLRPYGPKMAMVCFSCMTATPEREAEAEANFGAQLDSCGPVAVIDGTEVGPYPVEHSDMPHKTKTRGNQ